MTSIIARPRGYDIRLVDPCGIPVETLDFNNLIFRMNRFVDFERVRGLSVVRIGAPNDYTRDGERVCVTHKYGSYDLWYVEYRNDARVRFSLYDSVNDAFLEM